MSVAKVKNPARTDAATRRGAPAWARLYLFVTALVVPLVYSKSTIDPVEPLRFLVLACMGIVLVSIFAVRVLRWATTLSVDRAEALVLGCLTAYMLVAAISALIAGVTPDAILELLKLATFGWLIFASSRAIHGERDRLALLAKLVLTSSFIVGGFAILQYYQIAIFEWMKRDTTVDSTMGHRNLLASFVALAFPFVAWAFFELEGRWRVASAMTMLISGFLLVALQSRSVWVAFPSGLAFGLLVVAVAGKRAPARRDLRGMSRRRILQGAVSMLVGASVALLFQSTASRAPMRQHAESIVQLQHASVQERVQLWKRSIRMIRDHPLTGVGLGNWRVVLPTYGMEGLRSDTGTLHFQNPHNDILWAASETGLLGGLLYLAIFVLVLGLGVTAVARARTMHDRFLLGLLLSGVTCYAVDSLFSFPKDRMSHLVYLALLIGSLLSFRRDSENRPAAMSFSRRWTLVILVLASGTTLVAGQFAWSRYRAEVHLRRALEARAVKNWPMMIAELDRIDRSDYAIDPSSAPVVWYRGVARFEMGDRSAALADFQSALAVHPNHVHVLNNIATCQTLNGDNAAALQNYARAIELAPRFEEARVNFGFLLHSLGRDQEAYEVLAPIAADATSQRFKECFGVVKSALGLGN